jgi:hypothetical protein
MGSVLCKSNEIEVEVIADALVEKAKHDYSEHKMRENLIYFEKRFPFYMLDCAAYLGRVKRFV